MFHFILQIDKPVSSGVFYSDNVCTVYIAVYWEKHFLDRYICLDICDKAATFLTTTIHLHLQKCAFWRTFLKNPLCKKIMTLVIKRNKNILANHMSMMLPFLCIKY